MLITTLTKIIEEFRKIDPEMPMQTALAFITVSKYGDTPNGVSIKDISKIMGMSTAAASRNISKLSKVGAKLKKGHNLVETFEDPNFRVRKCVKLTPLGLRVMKSLEDILDDHKTT